MDADDRFEIEDVGPAKRSWRERTRHLGGTTAWPLMIVSISNMLMSCFWYHELTAKIEEERHTAQAQAETARVQEALKTLKCEVWSPGLDVRGVRDACGVFRGQPFEVVCGPKGWCEAKRVVSGGDGLSWGFVRFESGEPCDPELSRFLDAWFGDMKEDDDR